MRNCSVERVRAPRKHRGGLVGPDAKVKVDVTVCLPVAKQLFVVFPGVAWPAPAALQLCVAVAQRSVSVVARAVSSPLGDSAAAPMVQTLSAQLPVQHVQEHDMLWLCCSIVFLGQAGGVGSRVRCSLQWHGLLRRVIPEVWHASRSTLSLEQESMFLARPAAARLKIHVLGQRQTVQRS